MSLLNPELQEALDLLKECFEENLRLRAELQRLRRPSWRERLIAWIDPGPEVPGADNPDHH